MIPPPFLSTLTSPSLDGISPISAFPALDFFPIPALAGAGSAPGFPPSPLWIYFIAQESIPTPARKLLSKAGTKLFIIINMQRRFFSGGSALGDAFPNKRNPNKTKTKTPRKTNKQTTPPPQVDILEKLVVICGIMFFWGNFHGNKVIKVL